jgi:hypothetical protein
MRPITLEQHRQPDGSNHHRATSGCPLEPCAVIDPQGDVRGDPCDCLHSNGVDDEGNIKWCCSKPLCRSGV